MANEIVDLTGEAGDLAPVAAMLALAAASLGPTGMKGDAAKAQAAENYRYFLRLLLDSDAKEAAEQAKAEEEAARVAAAEAAAKAKADDVAAKREARKSRDE